MGLYFFQRNLSMLFNLPCKKYHSTSSHLFLFSSSFTPVQQHRNDGRVDQSYFGLSHKLAVLPDLPQVVVGCPYPSKSYLDVSLYIARLLET